MAKDKHDHKHHIVPDSMIYKVGGMLFLFTIITVAVAHVDLGALNFPVAMFVAACKATMVALFFMGLKYDSRENGVIFATSFIFLAIFFVLTGMDIFFRIDRYTNKKSAAEAMAFPGAKVVGSKLTKPWVSTPALVAKGKELFAVQCAACHGPQGAGDGPAAAGLNPKPRNFTQAAGWKNGRKVTMVYKTLQEGIPGSGMASYASVPLDDRWALIHYVLAIGPGAPEPDTAGDYAKVGIDPSKDTMGGPAEKPTIPVEFAIERLAE